MDEDVKDCFVRPFEVDGRLFGISVLDDEYDETLARALVFQLNHAVGRLSGICEIPEHPFFPIMYRSEAGFGTGTGYVIWVGKWHLDQLSKSAGTDHGLRVCLSIQSQYFHELIHRVRIGSPDEDYQEILPLLGEFLYDPASNALRNLEFAVLSALLKKNLLSGSFTDRYCSDWMTVTRILLWEHAQRGKGFNVPSSLEAQLEMLQVLPLLFHDMEARERDDIVRRYMLLPIEEVKRVSEELGAELSLDY